MRHLMKGLAALCAFAILASPIVVHAANAPVYTDTAGHPQGATGTVIVNSDGSFADATHPVPVANQGVAAGSTTAGQTGTTAMCATIASGADSAYTAGQTNPCTLTPTGRVRVALSAAGPVAPGTAATASDLGGCVYTASFTPLTDTQQAALQCDTDGSVRVRGSIVALTATPTVTASSAYAAGNTLGGLMTLSGAPNKGIIQNVAITFKSAQTASTDLILVNANPTGTTVTDKTAVALAVADFDKALPPIHVTDCTNTGTTSVCTATGLGIAYALPSAGTTLYAIAVTRGTPTFTATSDVSIRTTILLP